jgi:hypothetical protein
MGKTPIYSSIESLVFKARSGLTAFALVCYVKNTNSKKQITTKFQISMIKPFRD